MATPITLSLSATVRMKWLAVLLLWMRCPRWMVRPFIRVQVGRS